MNLGLGITDKEIGSIEKLLSHDEKTRANKFCFYRDKRRYIVSRSGLRLILGNYLNIDPCDIKFEYTQRGKPFLPSIDNKNSINFNLSHSNELVLYAITKNRLLGIDIEYIRPMLDLNELAKRYFIKDEYKTIYSVNAREKEKLFYKYWTCKEAYLKATGEGIAGLENINFIVPYENKEFSFIDKSGKSWNCYILTPEDEYIGSVVVE